MHQADDKTFIRRFSGIVLGLVIFTVVIIALAVSFRAPKNPEDNPSQQALAVERIAPVAAVRVGDEGKAALAAAQAQAAATAGSAFGGSLDGELIYNNVCGACHDLGVADAPVPGGTMNQRAGKGVDALVSSVIDGLNVMPPRAGRPDLTDEQIHAAVEYMLR